MRDILLTAGLSDSQYLIDVGCGCGRLAHTLTVERYLGTDVVPELLQHARVLCPNPRWRFELVDGTTIPERSGVADMVCFFSVLTHLLHEDSYCYLCEAQRVLRPGGKVVFSFLEFRAETHWAVFESMVQARAEKRETHHSQFLDRDAIWAWARYAGFSLERFIDGESHPLGESVCVLTAH
jgi:SAM-dependent methyltransferase